MKYKVIIPARANSKRLPGKNMKFLGNKPLIQYSIDYALNNFKADEIWVNSDDKEIIEFGFNLPPEIKIKNFNQKNILRALLKKRGLSNKKRNKFFF